MFCFCLFIYIYLFIFLTYKNSNALGFVPFFPLPFCELISLHWRFFFSCVIVNVSVHITCCLRSILVEIHNWKSLFFYGLVAVGFCASAEYVCRGLDPLLKDLSFFCFFHLVNMFPEK